MMTSPTSKDLRELGEKCYAGGLKGDAQRYYDLADDIDKAKASGLGNEMKVRM